MPVGILVLDTTLLSRVGYNIVLCVNYEMDDNNFESSFS